MKTKYTLVNNFKCRKCKVVSVSLDVHDYIQCPCGNYIDGGFDYMRRGGNSQDMQTLPLYWKKEPK